MATRKSGARKPGGARGGSRGKSLAPGKAKRGLDAGEIALPLDDERIAPLAGTKGHVARANRDYMFDKGQFDCIDTSRNITSLLLVLRQLKLLRHHDVGAPEARGFFIDGRPPHATAVLVESGKGEGWSVDAWTRAYGQPPEIMPLARWKRLG